MFIYLKASWAKVTDIEFIKNNQDLLFNISDFFIQFLTAIIIVAISVFVVAINTREVPEG